MNFAKAWSRAVSTVRTILSPFTKEYRFKVQNGIGMGMDEATLPSFINESENQLPKSRSRAVSTERTILSPFTKEYLVLAAYSGIRLFLEAYFLLRNGPSRSSSKYSFDSDLLIIASLIIINVSVTKML
ncbi:hypothetical protein ES332_D10G266000v1 [Gossypium tomentosum]|uniref:Uncharacterized protein n=1 Tax=Gossypium tomentosum TaxID=34277 RepID=A0A5D2J9N5_GOSTO|nr:hypothetical protein ES332_D10G266000v1 [Gossypium tomentosum]